MTTNYVTGHCDYLPLVTTVIGMRPAAPTRLVGRVAAPCVVQLDNGDYVTAPLGPHRGPSGCVARNQRLRRQPESLPVSLGVLLVVVSAHCPLAASPSPVFRRDECCQPYVLVVFRLGWQVQVRRRLPVT